MKKLTAIWENSEGTRVFERPGTDEVLVWHPERDYPVLRVAHVDGIHKWGKWTPVDPPVEMDVPDPEEGSMSKDDASVLKGAIDAAFTPAVEAISAALERAESVAKHGSGDQTPHGRRGSGNPAGTTPADRGSQAARGDALTRSTAQAAAAYKEAQAAVQADIKELARIVGKPMPGGRLDWGHVGSMVEARRQVAELLSFLRGDKE